jgi:hypothetical protein
LITLKGEIDTKQKSFSPARDITEAEVVAIVQKFLKGIGETISLLEGRNEPKALADAKAEKAVLEVYLPAQMTEAELTEFAKAKAAQGAQMGQIMGALKADKAGQYDGKLAASVVKSVLQG